MSEKEKRVLKTFEEMLPSLSDIELKKLLAFGEGMAFKIKQDEQRRQAAQTSRPA